LYFVALFALCASNPTKGAERSILLFPFAIVAMIAAGVAGGLLL
jgi:hypothetical protein